MAFELTEDQRKEIQEGFELNPFNITMKKLNRKLLLR